MSEIVCIIKTWIAILRHVFEYSYFIDALFFTARLGKNYVTVTVITDSLQSDEINYYILFTPFN